MIRPYQGNTGQRFQIPGRRAFSPDLQSDEIAINRLRRMADETNVPLSLLIERITANNLPPQLVQTAYITKVIANEAPALILPKNPARMSLLIALVANNGSGWLFSYDNPVNIAVGALVNLAGIPMAAPDFYEETNGSVSINDVYAWTIAQGAFPQFFIAYEGTLSVSGNKL